MSFADPQTITINAVAESFPRVAAGSNNGVFRTSDGDYELSIAHYTGNSRTRRVMKLNAFKIAADPLLSVNTEFRMGVNITIDLPKRGYTPTEAKLIVDGFLAYLSASSGAKITQLLGGEQ